MDFARRRCRSAFSFLVCNASVCLLKCVNVESLADFHDAGITSVGHKMILVATLRGSRPGVQSTSLIITALMTS